MDWAFTKTSTVRPHFSPTTPILHMQSSSSGQNNIIIVKWGKKKTKILGLQYLWNKLRYFLGLLIEDSHIEIFVIFSQRKIIIKKR